MGQTCWTFQFVNRQNVVVAGDEIVGRIESRKTTAEAMVDWVDLLAVPGGVVKGFAEGVANQRLEPAAGVAIVNLPGVVRRRSHGLEVGIVAERNDSELAGREHSVAARGARQIGTGRQSDTTKRRSGAERKSVVRANVDGVFAS